jgi:CBS domain-containing protein
VPDTISSILQSKGSQTFSIPPDASVYEAIAMMADKGVGALLVMTASRLVGIVSERDYARKVILQGRSSKDSPVSDIMTRDVITVTPGHTIDDCMRIVTECRIRHLPVVSGDRVTGMISIGDLVRAIISDQAHTISQLHSYICGAAVVR